jgi:fibronectin-binding autotransporter adhesin
LSGTNTYTGATVVSAGTLQIGNGAGSGTPGTATITNNAALVFNRTNDLTVANMIAGTGTLTKLGSGVLTLTGSNTFTGGVILNALNAGILRLRSNTALGIGPKTINLKSGGSPNSAGSYCVDLENNVTLGGDLSWNISNDGAANAPFLPALRSRSGVNTLAGNILIQSGGGGARVASDAGSTLNLTGNVTADVSGGRDLILDGAGTGVFGGAILNGADSTMFVNVIKEGNGSWTFAGTNDSGGRSILKAGTLVLTGLTGTNSLVTSNGMVLRGTGAVRGEAVINGIIAPGTVAGIGALTFSNTLSLAGSATMRLAKSPALTCDQLRGMSTLYLGGTLVVVATGAALEVGDTFQLFSAGNYQGGFQTVTLPALLPGRTWSNRLAVDGTLQVVAVSAPELAGSVLNETNLALRFFSEANVKYLLQQRESLDLPANWTTLSTNLGTGDIMTLTVPIEPAIPSRLFRLLAY